MAEPLAIYGAITGSVGVVAFGWNIWSWRRANVTRVDVDVREAIIAPPEGTQHVVSIDVVNHSAHSVEVHAVGVYVGGQTLQVVHRQGEIPGTVKARDSGTTWLPREAEGLQGELVGLGSNRYAQGVSLEAVRTSGFDTA